MTSMSSPLDPKMSTKAWFRPFWALFQSALSVLRFLSMLSGCQILSTSCKKTSFGLTRLVTTCLDKSNLSKASLQSKLFFLIGLERLEFRLESKIRRWKLKSGSTQHAEQRKILWNSVISAVEKSKQMSKIHEFLDSFEYGAEISDISEIPKVKESQKILWNRNFKIMLALIWRIFLKFSIQILNSVIL